MRHDGRLVPGDLDHPTKIQRESKGQPDRSRGRGNGTERHVQSEQPLQNQTPRHGRTVVDWRWNRYISPGHFENAGRRAIRFRIGTCFHDNTAGESRRWASVYTTALPPDISSEAISADIDRVDLHPFAMTLIGTLSRPTCGTRLGGLDGCQFISDRGRSAFAAGRVLSRSSPRTMHTADTLTP
jgi:hypothetical protein